MTTVCHVIVSFLKELLKLLSSLKSRDKEIFVGKYFNGESTGDIAEGLADNYCVSKIKGDTKISPDIHKIFIFFL